MTILSRYNSYSIKVLFIVFLAGLLLTSCTKEPGIGGNASISGRLYAKHYNSTFTVLLSEYPAPDEYVYLVFGDETNYGTRIKTNYKGEFEFNYLYPGSYTVYAYSIDSAAIVNFYVDPPEMAVIEEVTIDSRNAEIDLGDLILYK
jgi:hypothetical protein